MKKILYFSSSWCVPCKTLSPIMESLKGHINYQKIDADTNGPLLNAYQIRSIPTLILLEDNKVIGRLSGIQSKPTILSFYNG